MNEPQEPPPNPTNEREIEDPKSGGSRLDWLNLAILGLLVALFFWRIWTPNLADRQSFPPGDFALQFWAFSTFEVQELSAGRLPLWNPYTFAGSPFWADVQAAVFYPPSLLTLLLSTPWSHSAPWGFSLFALELEAIVHFWLAGCFMYLFIRRLTHSRPAALIASLTFTFSGYLTGYPSQQLAVLEADVWLPLILYFLHRVNWRAATNHSSNPPLLQPSLLLAGLAWGIALLAGHPQSTLIIFYTSTAYLIFLAITDRPSPPNQPFHASRFTPHVSRLTRHSSFIIRAWLLFTLTGLGLAAIQFIPAAEYTLLSVRAEGTYAEMSSGFPLIDVIQFLLPGQISLYSPLYIGVIGLILALWVIFRQPQRHILFWAIFAAVTLLISFGGNTFLYSPLYLTTPGFSIFRGQERWAFATAFALCVLVGYGFRALQVASSKGASRKVTGRKSQITNTTESSNPSLSDAPVNLQSPISNLPISNLQSFTKNLFLTALLLTFLCFYGLNDSGWQADSPFFALFGATTLLTLLLALTWLLWKLAEILPLVWLTIFTAALLCFDLFTVNWQTNLYPQHPEWHTQTPAIIAALKQDAATTPNEPYRVYNEFRLRDQSGDFPYDNYGIPFAIEDLWGASPLRPNRYDQFLAPPMPIERTWELLNVKYVITWREELYLPSTIIYAEPAPDGMTYLHRLTEVGPRAWLVTHAETATDPTILQTIADPDFERWKIALLEPSEAALSPQLADTPPATLPSVDIHPTPSANQRRYQTTTTAPALLILSETHYPGWQATVDGASVPILRTNYVLQAIPVPSGTHQVELTFQPLSFTVGAIVSGLTLILTTSWLSWQYRRRFAQQRTHLR